LLLLKYYKLQHCDEVSQGNGIFPGVSLVKVT